MAEGVHEMEDTRRAVGVPPCRSQSIEMGDFFGVDGGEGRRRAIAIPGLVVEGARRGIEASEDARPCEELRPGPGEDASLGSICVSTLAA